MREEDGERSAVREGNGERSAVREGDGRVVEDQVSVRDSYHCFIACSQIIDSKQHPTL